VAGKIRLTEKFNGLIGNQTHDVPSCIIVPQPTMLLHAPSNNNNIKTLELVVLLYVALCEAL
jgi:hypothetical protein